MTLEQKISLLAKSAVKALYDVEATDAQIQLQKTRPEFEGNITLVVFPFVKLARKAPQAVAQEIGEWMLNEQMVNGQIVNKFNAVQGFLNLSISDAFWVEQLKAIDADANYGHNDQMVNDQIVHPLMMVEYSSSTLRRTRTNPCTSDTCVITF